MDAREGFVAVLGMGFRVSGAGYQFVVLGFGVSSEGLGCKDVQEGSGT